MKRRLLRILLILLLVPPVMAAVMGWLVAPSFLHPASRPLTPNLIREADASFAHSHARREDFLVTSPDGVELRGWKVRAENPNGSWVLLFHGVADNRVGAIGQSEFLLRAGYNLVMMDQRAHGESGGAMATYGWLERNDTRAAVDALIASEHPAHIFALGESMGAGIALQSAGVDPRIERVVAEAPFASLREASYDYAGLQKYPLLGKTLLAPGAWVMLYRGGKLAGFSAAGVSPERAVAARNFPVLLICDEEDHFSYRSFPVATEPAEFSVPADGRIPMCEPIPAAKRKSVIRKKQFLLFFHNFPTRRKVLQKKHRAP